MEYLGGFVTRAEAAAKLEVSVSTFDSWLKRDALTVGNRHIARTTRGILFN